MIQASRYNDEIRAAILYVGYFHRAPAPDGLKFWKYNLAIGQSFDETARYFLDSDEANRNFWPNVTTTGGYLQLLYRNLFGRAPDAAGLAFWTPLIDISRPGEFTQYAMNLPSSSNDLKTALNKTRIAIFWCDRCADNGVTSYANWSGGGITNNRVATSAESILNGITHTDISLRAAYTNVKSFWDTY